LDNIKKTSLCWSIPKSILVIILSQVNCIKISIIFII
jgi:hypothetical protein